MSEIKSEKALRYMLSIESCDVGSEGMVHAVSIAEIESEEPHAKHIEQMKNKIIEAYKLNCHNYTACCFDRKPCTADCEYLADFIEKLNEL